MKKFWIFLITTALIAGVLGGCRTEVVSQSTSDNSGLIDTETADSLNSQLQAIDECGFESEVVLTLPQGSTLGEPLSVRYVKDGTWSGPLGEMVLNYYYEENGKYLFDTDMLISSDTLHLNALSVTQYVINLLGEQDDQFKSISAKDLLDGQEYVKLASQDLEKDVSAYIADIFPQPCDITPVIESDDPEQYITPTEDAFTISLRGNELGGIADSLIYTLSANAEAFNDILGIDLYLQDILDAFQGGIWDEDGQLRSELEYVLTLSGSEGSFRQTVELALEGEFSVALDSSYTVRSIDSANPPENALTLQEYEEILEELMLNSPLESSNVESSAISGIEDIEKVYDLSEINLIDHSLPSDTVLAIESLPNGYGDENAVSVIAGSEISQYDYELYSFGEGVSLYYISLDNYSATAAVELIVDYDLEEFFYSDSNLSASPLRSSSDRTSAVMAIAEDTPNLDEQYLCIYLAQSISGTDDVIILDIIVYVDYLTPDDYTILAELGDHVGVNLLDYLSLLPADEL